MSSPKEFINTLTILDGIITYNDFDIDEDIAFQKQENSYKEDILQIEFGSRYILDVGWYPEANPEGYFWVRGIEDCNWQEPLISIQCRSLHQLKEEIEKIATLLSLKNGN